MKKFLNQKVNALHIVVVLCFGALIYQNYELEEIKTHHWFAVKTVNEQTFVAQQCESVVSQCCK
jgi:hypothetical protein